MVPSTGPRWSGGRADEARWRSLTRGTGTTSVPGRSRTRDERGTQERRAGGCRGRGPPARRAGVHRDHGGGRRHRVQRDQRPRRCRRGHDVGCRGHDVRAASGTHAEPTDAEPTDATSTDATSTDATSTDATTASTSGHDDATTETLSPAAGSTPTDGETTTATVPAATLPGENPAPTPAPDAAPAADGDEEWADAEDKAYRKELRKGFAFGTVGGLLIGAIVALLLGALVWPGYLLGPGNPDDTANQVTSALSAKDGPTLDRLSCKGEDGRSVTQLSGQVLQYITKVAPAGPTTRLLDTEARTPVDVTLSVQGQTQTLPSELVLGESKGDWCLKGLAQRQQ